MLNDLGRQSGMNTKQAAEAVMQLRMGPRRSTTGQ